MNNSFSFFFQIECLLSANKSLLIYNKLEITFREGNPLYSHPPPPPPAPAPYL